MTDEELEALIEKAGRYKVLALAQAWGWMRGSIPPKYVWISICHEILKEPS